MINSCGDTRASAVDGVGVEVIAYAPLRKVGSWWREPLRCSIVEKPTLPLLVRKVIVILANEGRLKESYVKSYDDWHTTE